MNISILPVFVLPIFAFCIFLTRRAQNNQTITKEEAKSVTAMLIAFTLWTVISVVLGFRGVHLSLMEKSPFLWQSFVPVTVLMIALLFPTIRSGLSKIATSTPGYWFVFIQALRIGALGGIIKGLRGEISSSFVFWIGIPDFLFGLSALVVGWLLMRNAVSPKFIIAWNLVGFSLIMFPTFGPMTYWMNEPGFSFIFEFPMVLAPSIVIPTFISLNLLGAWGVFAKQKKLSGQSEFKTRIAVSEASV